MRKFILGFLMANCIGASMQISNAADWAVGTDKENKPFNFVEGGKRVGFDQDILAEVAKDLGKSYKVTAMDFSALVPGLQTGSLDAALASIYVTEARKQVIDFSEPYYQSALGIMVRKDDNSIQAIQDLKGKVVASVTGGGGAKWLKANMPDNEARLFPSVTELFLELESGRAQAIVFDYPTLAYYAQSGGAAKVKMVPQMVGEPIPVAIAFPKGSALVPQVNAVLEKMRADGRYDAIYRKWFNRAP